MSTTKEFGDLPKGERVPVSQGADTYDVSVDERDRFRSMLLRIASVSNRTADNEYKREQLNELAEFIGLDHSDWNKEQLITNLSISAKELVDSEAEQKSREQEAEDADDRWHPPVQRQENQFDGSEEAPVYFGYRCLRCSTVCIRFKPGFDPRRPGSDEAGNRLLFHMWPFEFLGWSHYSAAALRCASREAPVCHFCGDRVPLFQEGRTLKSRGIVAFADFDFRKEIKPLPQVKSQVDKNVR